MNTSHLRPTLAAGLARAQWVTLVTAAVALPLAVDWNASDSYVLPKLLLARAAALLLLAMWLLRGALAGRIAVRRTALDWPVLALVASAGLSTVFAVNHNLAIFGAYERYEGLLTILLYAALFWLTAQSLDGMVRARALISALLLGGYVAAVVAIGQSLLASAHGVAAGESAFTFAGVARAHGTLGNPNLLAALLAMLLPLAIGRVIRAASVGLRIAWLNVVLVMSLALLLTFGRAGLLAAAVSIAFLVGLQFRAWINHRLLFGLTMVVLLLTAATLALEGHGGIAIEQSVASRVASIADPTAGSNATRLHVWQDTIRLIASRPVLGYGPDTFGLVYPRFQSGDWTPGFRIDKAHADTLQVAATQGLLGLGAYLALMACVVAMFWRRRRRLDAAALFAGWLGYEIVTQVNFSWLPAAAPFWVFLGIAAMVCADEEPSRLVLPIDGKAASATVAICVIGCMSLLLPGVLRPYEAEAAFSRGLQAEVRGDPVRALASMAQAHDLAPENPVYDVAAGNLLLQEGRFNQARSALTQAIELGSEDPAAAHSLAVIDAVAGG